MPTALATTMVAHTSGMFMREASVEMRKPRPTVGEPKNSATMAPIRARAPKAAKALVKLGVRPDADQRSYDATPELVAALTAAAMEWANDTRTTPAHAGHSASR